MGLGGWVLFWIIASPFIACWLALKLLILIGKGIAWLIRQASDAPAIPAPLRKPPARPVSP
jgi:hypothetical protein